MLMGIKIRLIPTKEQEIQFKKSAGTSRWAYNFFVFTNKKQYKLYKQGLSNKSYVNGSEIRKKITQMKRTAEFEWLNEVSANVTKQAVTDADSSAQRHFKNPKRYGFPRIKSRYTDELRFYVNYETLKRTDIGFRGEKLGNVKTEQPFPKLKPNRTYSNPHIYFNGKCWMISFAIDVKDLTKESNKIYWKRINKFNDKTTTHEIIGVDLGIKELAIVSDTTGTKIKHYENINYTKEVRRLERRLKHEKRALSRCFESNVAYRDANKKPHFKRKLCECKNYQRQRKRTQRVATHLSNIRENYVQQVTTDIVKHKPQRLVYEDLNVKAMMKNHHLARHISNQCWGLCKQCFEYKCKRLGIEVIKANRWFASSKTCHVCGHKKKDLTLKDREFTCDNCGTLLDRDENAAINLANYVA